MSLKWSHATNSLKTIDEAFLDDSITAIECDVMLGVAKEGERILYDTPILAHPPNRESDVSFATLLLRVTKNINGTREIQKHLKLDFKQIEVLEPCLELLQMTKLANPLGKTVFFNADILQGPGRRNDNPIPADLFVERCLTYIRSCKGKNIVSSLSLGYICDWACDEPYEMKDVLSMVEIANQFKLTADSGIGLVLALNARLLASKPDAFDGFLQKFPHSTILAWTGAGEPSIPQKLVDKICEHFSAEGIREKIDFDCLVDVPEKKSMATSL